MDVEANLKTRTVVARALTEEQWIALSERLQAALGEFSDEHPDVQLLAALQGVMFYAGIVSGQAGLVIDTRMPLINVSPHFATGYGVGRRAAEDAIKSEVARLAAAANAPRIIVPEQPLP